MVKNENPEITMPEVEPSPQGTPIHVAMADEDPHEVTTSSAGFSPSGKASTFEPSPMENHADQRGPHDSEAPSGATIPPHELDEEHPARQEDTEGAPPAAGNFTPLTDLVPNADKEDTGEYGAHHVDNLPAGHEVGGGSHNIAPLQAAPGAGPKRRWPKLFMWLFILLFMAVVAAYLAIDAGLIKSDVNLPFHIFNKQKTSSSTSATQSKAAAPQPVSQPPAQSAVPTGFTTYKVDGADVSFAYPTAWGTPTVTKDPGFSKRGSTNKSDGTHAYLVDFATNKDTEVALTSSKYLPAARAALYYDFLQWCTGTNDGKLYKQTLKFTTDAGKVDTPGTITCDQGPMTDAVKLDDTTTIFQQKTKDATGAVIGDLYTKNLPTKDLTVLRVKDAQSKNGDDIKKLLATIKLNLSSSSSNTDSTNPISTSTTN
jgi:hypothetical protein